MTITSIAIIWQQDGPNLLVPPWSKPCPHSGIMEGFRLPRNRGLACGSPNPSRMEGQTQSDGTAAGGWLPVGLGGCRGVQAGLWGSITIIWWKGRPNLMVPHGGRSTEAVCRGRQKVAVPQAHSSPKLKRRALMTQECTGMHGGDLDGCLAGLLLSLLVFSLLPRNGLFVVLAVGQI